MQLRLLLFDECNRSCEGCCNKQWDLTSLPVCDNFSGYDLIMLTGGEPMLRPNKIRSVVRKIREQTDCPIYLYTAKVNNINESLRILKIVDGFTVTLHDQYDLYPFMAFNLCISRTLKKSKSLRLNVFKDIQITETPKHWIIKKDIKWIDPCPLPENEKFMRV